MRELVEEARQLAERTERAFSPDGSHISADAATIRSLADALGAAERRVDELREALREYADHSSWRCAYRSRYKTCRCGLDETMTRLGLEPVEVIDPEAECDSTEAR